jgi:hypothetical protein
VELYRAYNVHVLELYRACSVDTLWSLRFVWGFAQDCSFESQHLETSISDAKNVIIIIIIIIMQNVSCNSSDNTDTRLRVRFATRTRHFSLIRGVQTSSEAHLAFSSETFCGQRSQSVNLKTHVHLVRKLRMCGVTPAHYHTPSTKQNGLGFDIYCLADEYRGFGGTHCTHLQSTKLKL